MNIDHLRREYHKKAFDKSNAALNPFDQFRQWFQEAVDVQADEPNAMVLATANKEGKPSSRTVLLKIFDDDGLVFFTNYESRKAQDLEVNPLASVTFLWHTLERQVTVDGSVEKVPRDISEIYFSKRPRASQIGSRASHQSTAVRSRAELEEEYHRIDRKYTDKEIPCPSYWGGYRIRPNRFEFWQGRPNRLHDRLCYLKQHDGWDIVRLSP